MRMSFHCLATGRAAWSITGSTSRRTRERVTHHARSRMEWTSAASASPEAPFHAAPGEEACAERRFMRVADQSAPTRKVDGEDFLVARKNRSTTARSIVTMAQDKPGNPIHICVRGLQRVVLRANFPTHVAGRRGDEREPEDDFSSASILRSSKIQTTVCWEKQSTESSRLIKPCVGRYSDSWFPYVTFGPEKEKP